MNRPDVRASPLFGPFEVRPAALGDSPADRWPHRAPLAARNRPAFAGATFYARPRFVNDCIRSRNLVVMKGVNPHVYSRITRISGTDMVGS
jgi:hypothetical protein